MCDIGLRVALANLLSEVIMVRDGFLSLPTWFSRNFIEDVYPVFVFRPSAPTCGCADKTGKSLDNACHT